MNREYELQRLRGFAETSNRNLALLYGRRRVGKTHLLTHAWDRHRALYFTASATDPELNRQALLREASAWSGESLRGEDYPTWRTVFRAVFGLRPDEHLVVVLDEFQYLANDDDGLKEVASELNAVWEGRLGRQAGLTVVLSGSAVHALSALEKGGSPLFGRLDWRCRLQPFDYFWASQMVPTWSPRDRILAYAAFGGTPKYLDVLDRSESLDENIVRHLISPDGNVRIQVETALEQEEGLRDSSRYRAILAAVGLKRRTLGEIASALGEPKNSGLQRMVNILVELEYLEEEQNFGAARRSAKRYRLADPAQRFYYGMVLPNESAIASAGPHAVWRERLVEQVWPSYVGDEVFEDVVCQAYRRIAGPHGAPLIEDWGRWAGKDWDRQDIELDVVARTLNGAMLTGSAKFRQEPASATMLTNHVDVLTRLAGSGYSWAEEALEEDAPLLMVSSAGFKDSFHDVAEEVGQPIIAWTLADLLST